MKKKYPFSPFIKITFSFLVAILTGALLLMLPFSTKSTNIGFIDAIFMSTSSVCVTGLSVISDLNATFTIFGKVVIGLLLEIGGLGFITIAMFFVIILRTKIGVNSHSLIKESLNLESREDLVKLVKKIIVSTLIIQGIGALLTSIIVYFTLDYSFFRSIGVGIFHSIAAFNNSGLNIFGNDNQMIFSNNYFVIYTTIFLITTGGIGHLVIFDVFEHKKFKKLSLDSKIAITTTGFMIISGTILLRIFTDFNWVQSLFMASSARTAGFSANPLSSLKSAPGLFIIILIMFIGASPCSTGGGIKTTTFYIVIKTIFCFLFGKNVVIHKRRIANATIFKAFALTIFSLLFVSIVMISVAFIEMTILNKTNIDFADITFESFSAFSTAGLSTGITEYLHWTSKLIICLTMFLGRIGPITFFNVWNKNRLSDNHDIKYIEKKLLIG